MRISPMFITELIIYLRMAYFGLDIFWAIQAKVPSYTC